MPQAPQFLNMYSPPMSRVSQDDDRHRGQPLSPTHGHSRSPNRTHPPSPQFRSSLAASGKDSMPPHLSPREGTMPSPSMNGSAHPLQPYNNTPPATSSTRYDPLADHRDQSASRKRPLSQTQSPIQVSVDQEDAIALSIFRMLISSSLGPRLLTALQ